MKIIKQLLNRLAILILKWLGVKDFYKRYWNRVEELDNILMRLESNDRANYRDIPEVQNRIEKLENRLETVSQIVSLTSIDVRHLSKRLALTVQRLERLDEQTGYLTNAVKSLQINAADVKDIRALKESVRELTSLVDIRTKANADNVGDLTEIFHTLGHYLTAKTNGQEVELTVRKEIPLDDTDLQNVSYPNDEGEYPNGPGIWNNFCPNED